MHESLEIKGIWEYQALNEYDSGNLITGALVILEREPRNVHDHNAVIVKLGKNSAKLGYIPRQNAALISKCLASNVKYEARINRVGFSSYYGKRNLSAFIELELFVDPIIDLSSSTEISIPEDPSDDYTCSKCDKRIGNKPAILIDGNRYCYKCSQKALAEIQNGKYRDSRRQYETAEIKFQEAKNDYEEELKIWNEDFEKATRINRASKAPIYWVVIIAFAVVGHLAVSSRGILWGMILGCVFIFWDYGRLLNEDRKKEDLLKREFLSRNPKPHLTKVMPDTPTIEKSFNIPSHEANDIDSYNRNAILRRDKLQCQRCKKKRDRNDLEVHHIIPRSRGGTNDHKNLITLCKWCHDREEWFGHKRAYPTTL